MGVIKNLFGGGGSLPPTRDVAALVAPLSKPAAQMLRASGDGCSYFGGQPSLSDEIVWPSSGGKPLTFLACVDLASLARAITLPWLPNAGRLLFFYDVENQPWGFDPKHRGGCAVLSVPDEAARLRRSAAPGALPHHDATFRPVDTYPSWEREEIRALKLNDAETDDLIDVCDNSYGEEPRHQIGGFPSPIQGDGMELESQLVSNGVYCGDSSGYQSPRAAELSAGANDWRLLLQLDSDDDLGVMWGDGGMLYFWIREQDARAGRFENAWAILQCH